MSTADHSEGSGHRLGTRAPYAMDVSASLMCDSTNTSFQLVNNDDDCVIVEGAEHAARTLLSFGITRMLDGRTFSACH